MVRTPGAVLTHDKDGEARLQKGEPLELDLPEPPKTPIASSSRGSWLQLTPEVHPQRFSEQSRNAKEEDKFQKDLNEALDYHQARMATMDIDPDAFDLLVERNKSIRKTLDERQKKSEEEAQRQYENLFKRRTRHAALTPDEQAYLEAIHEDYRNEVEEDKIRRASETSTLDQIEDEDAVRKRRSLQQAVVSRYHKEKAREAEKKLQTEELSTEPKGKSYEAKADHVIRGSEDVTASVKGMCSTTATTKLPAEPSASEEHLQGLPNRLLFDESKIINRKRADQVPQKQPGQYIRSF